jgi:hypothetical protein
VTVEVGDGRRWTASDQLGFDGKERVTSVSMTTEGAVRWRIDAADSTVRVIEIGGDVEGFKTVVPLVGDLAPGPGDAIVVDYIDSMTAVG